MLNRHGLGGAFGPVLLLGVSWGLGLVLMGCGPRNTESAKDASADPMLEQAQRLLLAVKKMGTPEGAAMLEAETPQEDSPFHELWVRARGLADYWDSLHNDPNYDAQKARAELEAWSQEWMNLLADIPDVLATHPDFFETVLGDLHNQVKTRQAMAMGTDVTRVAGVAQVNLLAERFVVRFPQLARAHGERLRALELYGPPEGERLTLTATHARECLMISPGQRYCVRRYREDVEPHLFRQCAGGDVMGDLEVWATSRTEQLRTEPVETPWGTRFRDLEPLMLGGTHIARVHERTGQLVVEPNDAGRQQFALRKHLKDWPDLDVLLVLNGNIVAKAEQGGFPSDQVSISQVCGQTAAATLGEEYRVSAERLQLDGPLIQVTP